MTALSWKDVETMMKRAVADAMDDPDTTIAVFTDLCCKGLKYRPSSDDFVLSEATNNETQQ